MKTQISRNSRQAGKNYSSVCHQQGRMLTDSDLTEQALLTRDRLSRALQDVIGSGTPRFDALLQVTQSGSSLTPSLHWGRVYVDGVPAEVLAAKSTEETPVDPHIFNYNHQLRYPQAPQLPETAYRLYLDVWERAVSWLEDENLRDPGLHGADTTTRTQTMAQVKWCDTETQPLCPQVNPSVGDAQLTLTMRRISSEIDNCDPCSEELDLKDPVGNYLFRVELHDVHYDEQVLPAPRDEANPVLADEVTLKWSSENGAEAYKVTDVPPDFISNQYVYEFFNDTDEQHSGNHLARDGSNNRYIDGQREELLETYPASAPAGKTYVRRWDGFCKLVKTAGNWLLDSGFEGNTEFQVGVGSPGTVVQGGDSVTIELRVFTLLIELADNALLCGDYWSVPVRESIHQQGDILLQDEETGSGVLPHGEPHHYMLLVDVAADGSSMTLPEGIECDDYDACQLAQFPSLTDLQSTDICHTNPECEDNPSLHSLLADANPSLASGERIKLDHLLNTILCQTNAATLPLNPQPLCGLLQEQGAETVQDALNIICEFDDDGCATFSIAPTADWAEVFNRIADRGNAHICFHEGNFTTSETIVVRQKGHLKISCAGEGSIFTHQGNEAVIRFENCLSVKIDDGVFRGGKSGAGSPQDQTFDHINGALTFDDCGEINLHRVVMQSSAGTRLFASCLTVSSAAQSPGSVRVSECRFEVGHQQTGLLLLNQRRISVMDNQILVRRKPKSMTLDSMLKDYTVANSVKNLMIQGSVIRDFDKLESTQRGELQNLQTDSQAGNRQVMFDSPLAANHWKTAISSISTNPTRYSSNNELLNTVKNTAIELLRNPLARAGNSAIAGWITGLEQQNPAVMSSGIVCGGNSAKEIRILNNTISGVHMGIQVGVSNRKLQTAQTFTVGTTRIQGNSINVLLSPLASRRRGGIFVGNCTQLNIVDNSVQVQRFSATNRLRIESLRIYGVLGRKIIVKDNYSNHCNIGIRVTPVDRQDGSQQWLVADNMFVDASTAVDAPATVKRRNNLT